MIPRKFVREYAKNLVDHVFLKTPNRSFWQVELERTNGEVWLHNGWHEFAKYYSICFGHFLVFRYEGDSVFHVIIFDKSATEVEYPMGDACDEQVNINGGFQEGKEASQFPKMKKPRVADSQSYKKARGDLICEEVKYSGECCMKEMNESEHAFSTKRMKTKHTCEPGDLSNQKEHFPQSKTNSSPHNRLKLVMLEKDLDSHDSIQELKGKGNSSLRPLLFLFTSNA